MTRVLVRNDFSVVASRNSAYAVYFFKASFISANRLYVTPLGNRLTYFLTCLFHRYAWSHSSLTRLHVHNSLPCSSGRRKRVVSLNNGGIIFYDFPVSWPWRAVAYAEGSDTSGQKDPLDVITSVVMVSSL